MRLKKIFIAIFAPGERPPSSATLFPSHANMVWALFISWLLFHCVLHLITLRRQVIKSKQAKIYGFLQNAISLQALVKNAQSRLLSKHCQRHTEGPVVDCFNSFTNLLYLPPINGTFGFHHLWTALAAFPAVDINKITAPFKSKHHYKRTDKAKLLWPNLDKLSI